MGEASLEKPLEDRLDSWKEIAAYLNRDVTTVQRWEKREGMPVHRHQHDRMGSVYGSRAELDAWVRSRNLRATLLADGNSALSSHPASSRSAEAPSTLRRRNRFVYVAAAALAVMLAIGCVLWLQRTELFWRSPLKDAQFRTVTDFGGAEQAAAVSPDGHFVAFLSDRDGQVDVWVTQAGSGQFHNLTRGSAPELVNVSVRTLGFSPDGSLITFWTRRNGNIGIWAVPILGGQPKPYLDGVAEFDWTHDGSRLAYHTPEPGDPLFVSDGSIQSVGQRPIFTAPAGFHSHFPVWSPDGAFLYFVHGELPDKLDIWRISPSGGTPERITSHNGSVSHPVLLDRRTLLYLASDHEGGGPWLYSMDVERRVPHQLSSGVDRYTSLAATADGRRLVATMARARTTLWSVRLAKSSLNASTAAPIRLTTGTGYRPRQGPDYLLYVAAAGNGESIWKLASGISTQLWADEQARIFGGPAISSDGRRVAFSVGLHGQTLLYVMQVDGTGVRVAADSIRLQGSPVWAPDGQSILSAGRDHGIPHLFRIPLDSRPATPFVREYSIDPAWAPGGQFAVYSGPDVGTTFAVKAVTAEGAQHPIPSLTLTRGARRLVFLPGGRALVALRGETQHKDLWRIDLDTGAEQQLTDLPRDFNVRDFDISPDGRQVVLERVEERSDVLLMDLKRP